MIEKEICRHLFAGPADYSKLLLPPGQSNCHPAIESALREGRGEREVTGEQFVRMEASLFILVRPPDNDNPPEL